ncbi:hypothetical protein SEA_RAVENCO17_29 [Gordonia phage RavenCo17]|nr:hypothetical protein SEA_RAVENCO17_29 [Gordonia phage RavenCo17]
MGILNFNIVLLGSNLPVDSIDLSDFSFRHRELTETLRVPVALQAEARGVKLSIFGERFEVAVVDPYDVPKDANHLVEMATTFFEYVGPRSITATGHNAQFTIDGTGDKKAHVQSALMKMDNARDLIGHDITAADAAFYLKLDAQSVTRMSIFTRNEGDVVVDFNVNYDRGDLKATEAVQRFPDNLLRISDIVERLGTKLIEKATA